MPLSGGEDFLKYILIGGLLGLLPVIAATTTAFLKLSIVFSVLRTALGLQQTPSNLIIFSFAIMLTAYVMAPVFLQIFEIYQTNQIDFSNLTQSNFQESLGNMVTPYRQFLALNSDIDSIDFFYNLAVDKFPDSAASKIERDSLAVLMPSFMVTQLSEAFKITVLIYLPFLIIDLVVGIILLTFGMMMMSPVVVSLPIKILLFVMLDGWKFLTEALVNSFTV